MDQTLMWLKTWTVVWVLIAMVAALIVGAVLPKLGQGLFHTSGTRPADYRKHFDHCWWCCGIRCRAVVADHSLARGRELADQHFPFRHVDLANPIPAVDHAED